MDGHYDLSVQSEETLSSHALNKPGSMEETVLHLSPSRLDGQQKT